jgi:hypothetical protein
MESTAGQSQIGPAGHSESVHALSGKNGVRNQRWHIGHTLWYHPHHLTVFGCSWMAVI